MQVPNIGLDNYKVKPREYLRVVWHSGMVFLGEWYEHPALAALDGDFIKVKLGSEGPQVYRIGPDDREFFLCIPQKTEWPYGTYMQPKTRSFTGGITHD